MTSRAVSVLRRVAFAVALAALFLFAALFRFLHLKDGFPNDHFLYLAGAQQMLFGEWPTRDFVDPGQPLMYVASALAQVLLGPSLFAEAMLVAVSFALAAVLTAAAVRALTGSRVLAVLAGVLEIAIVPRTYGYPKLLVYAVGFLALQRYVTRPTTGRLLAVAGAIVFAFLFRHDHGIYLGIGGVLAAFLAPVAGDGQERWRRAALLAGMTALMAAPYFVYLQVYGGVWSYVQTGLEFRSGELSRQPHVWPAFTGALPHQAVLLYLYWAIPIVAALLLFASRRREDASMVVARVAPLVSVTLLVNWTFLRDPLTTRLQDAIVPAVTLGAWLTACAWNARHRWVWGPVSALLIVLFAGSVMRVGSTIEQLDRASLLVTWTRLPEFINEVSSALRAPHAERQLTSRTAYALSTFYPYIERCTTPQHRLLVVGFAPEVPVFTKRAFAGGQSAFIQGYYGSEKYQQAVLQHLAREVVPLVVMPAEVATTQFRAGFPIVANYVSIRYVPLVTLGADASTGVHILFDSTLPVAARDPATGWPCEVNNEWTVYAKGSAAKR